MDVQYAISYIFRIKDFEFIFYKFKMAPVLKMPIKCCEIGHLNTPKKPKTKAKLKVIILKFKLTSCCTDYKGTESPL